MSTPGNQSLCPHCGAETIPAADECWLCMEPSNNPYAVGAGSLANPTVVVDSRTDLIDRIAAYSLLGLVVLVGVGIAVDEPAGLFGYAIVLLPGVIGGLRARQRQQRLSRKGFFGSRTAAVLRGGVTIVVVYFLLIVALVMLLFTFCTMSGVI